MKIRVKIPENIAWKQELINEFVDDILLWGMETGMDVEFYTIYRLPNKDWNDKRRWAVFIVEADRSFMFSLKWGALQHKGKTHEENHRD